MSGKLHDEDYRQFVPAVEAIRANGKIRLLAQFHDFHGWDLHAVWEDIKFSTKHCQDGKAFCHNATEIILVSLFIVARAVAIGVRHGAIPYTVALVLVGLVQGLPVVLVLSLPPAFPHCDLLVSMTFGVGPDPRVDDVAVTAMVGGG